MRTSVQDQKGKGFTLLELMAVVAILSILATAAIPLLGKYLRKSKTTEVGLNLRKIYDGEVAYYVEEQTLQSGALASKQFVSLAPTPSSPMNDKQPGNFETEGWRAIKFSPDGNVLYSYSAIAGGFGLTASFTARGVGDLDGDGNTSLFERVGSVNSSGAVEGGAALFSLDELE